LNRTLQHTRLSFPQCLSPCSQQFSWSHTIYRYNINIFIHSTNEELVLYNSHTCLHPRCL